jgi:hypothetical protein
MQITRTFYLELNTVPMACPAWEIPDLSPLLDNAQVRGSDRILPSVDGVLAYRRRPTATVVTLPLDVVGLVDWDGNTVADPFAQLNIHMDYLRTNLGFASATGDGTVPAILHRGSVDPMVGDVHFLGFKGSRTMGAGLLRTTFDLSIPAGQLGVSGS